MPAIRRSLQAPRPDEPYLTEGHDVIPKIEEALGRNKGKGDMLRIMAMDIGEAWFNKDDASRVTRMAIFGCEILLLIWSIEGCSQAGGRGGSSGPLTAACMTSGSRISGGRPRRYWRRPRTRLVMVLDHESAKTGGCRTAMWMEAG
ncbi:uncharacterized protein BKA55DRAFT_582871 [Fusarium redolens]|uniref:Uncharacterized protein n=1 Tax=Fusarium redolens TaxID=48865 RepID=A0A9P9FZB8_FUSRE|nr:uncharacterized protein BKA55DRAFT_582871 [Fusarium redolens]KAH7230455.1 hypothetical protein BKA55DRAFT_582871 [Fusarium redolens]